MNQVNRGPNADDFEPSDTLKDQRYVITNRDPSSTGERKNSTFGRNARYATGQSMADTKSNPTDRYVNTTLRGDSEPLMFSFTKNDETEHEYGEEVEPLGKIEEDTQENNQTQSEA